MASVINTSAPAEIGTDQGIRNAMSAVAAHTGLSEGVVGAAERFAASKVPCLGISGWLASGKDTVAEAVFAKLKVPAVQQSFGAALKNELDVILDLVRNAEDLEKARTTVGTFLTADDGSLDILFAALVPGEFSAAQAKLAGVDARSRTVEVRAGLQKLGTDIRRAQDDLYWVNQGLAGAISQMARTVPVYFTDVRFPNEAAGLRSVGIPVVRLDISREVQAQRLWDRDRLHLDPVATAHPSETALDDWGHFNLIVDNDGTVGDAVSQILDAFGWLER